MTVIRARNVNDAWFKARVLLNSIHTERPSRVGKVWEFPEPVTTVYAQPLERVLFHRQRNANPYFHLMESLHMLAGRNDIAWLEKFNSKIRDFVGKEDTQHGAYGYRWRRAFDLDGGAEDNYADQLPKIVRMLKKSPDERRAVLTMWNPVWDLERPEIADVPCNTQAYFKIRSGLLSMTVTCRSNDIVFGCYGANAVHFAFLLEYMASMIGVTAGPYFQVSDSWHAYTERWEQLGGLDPMPGEDPYSLHRTEQMVPLIGDTEWFDAELKEWMARTNKPLTSYRNPFLSRVAEPLWRSWEYYKQGNFDMALANADDCLAWDWRAACRQWLKSIEFARRKAKGALN